MSRLFPSPFRQYIRSAIRGESVGIAVEAEFGAEAEVFPQPLLAKSVNFGAGLSHSLVTPTNIHKIAAPPTRVVHVETCRNILAPAASWTASGVATVVTPTDAPAPAVFSALAEVEQI